MTCYLFEPPIYFFFFESLAAADIPALLYYSHIPTAIISLLVGIFVLLNGPKKLTNQLLFFITLCFSLWVLYSLISWTNVDGSFIAFVWPFFAATKTLLAILCVYFIYVFINHGKDVSAKVKLIFLLLLAPVFIFAPTDLSLTGFDIVNCDAFMYEGLQFKYYYTAVSYLAMVWILVLLVRAYRLANKAFKQQILWMGLGIELFLFLFITIVFIVTYLTNVGALTDSRLEMYALFGQTFFMIAISFMIVRFKTFQINLVAANALIIGLLILVGSQLTFAESNTSVVLTALTLVLTAVTGIILSRSVKKEIQQREELQKLTADLAKANKRLKKLDKLKSEFVSIASHQLRSPLTAIRGYASMLAEGSFGKIPEKAKVPVERIVESSRRMAEAVEEYLNVSRIESGNMQYNLSDFNLKTEVEKITDDIRPLAMKKKLVLLFRNKLNSKGIVNADIGKATQIIHNLINNSIKYTQQGSITVLIRDDLKKKRLYVDIIDTGIGMSQDTIDRVFEKFERADNANLVNVSGTGLGLFVALKMAQAMGGDITAISEGDGKGSTFTFELPLVA
jgi:signal transduction histidine kinase